MATVKMSLNNDVKEKVSPVEDGKVRSIFEDLQADGVPLTFQVKLPAPSCMKHLGW